jgi:hypothetical protein
METQNSEPIKARSTPINGATVCDECTVTAISFNLHMK